ncbi:MAG: hypothetical protein JXB62_08140 [Pirellulales bacterium]|nr:hypothetical protein [Pirellulales bacterium]
MCAFSRIVLCVLACVLVGLCPAAPARAQLHYVPGTWFDQDKPNDAGDHWTRNCYNDSNGNGEFDPGEPWNGTANTPDPGWTNPVLNQVDNSCWAAAGSNLLRYVGGPSRYFSWCYNDGCYGGRTWQDGGHAYEALEYAGYDADPRDIDDDGDNLPGIISTYVARGFPVTFALDWDGGGAHAITCYAIDRATNQVWLADSDRDVGGGPFFTSTVTYDNANDEWELVGNFSPHHVYRVDHFDYREWIGSGVNSSETSGWTTEWDRSINWEGGLSDPDRLDQLVIDFEHSGRVNVTSDAGCGKLSIRGANPQLHIIGTRLYPTALQVATGTIVITSGGHLDVDHEICADGGLTVNDGRIDAGGDIYLGYENTPPTWYLQNGSALTCDTLYLGYRSNRGDGATGTVPHVRILSGSYVDTSEGIVSDGIIYVNDGTLETSGDLVNNNHLETYNGSMVYSNADLVNTGMFLVRDGNVGAFDDFVFDGSVDWRDTTALAVDDAFIGPNAYGRLYVSGSSSNVSVGNLNVGGSAPGVDAIVDIANEAHLLVRDNVNLTTPQASLALYNDSYGEVRGNCVGPDFTVHGGSRLEVDGNFIIGQNVPPAELLVEDSTVDVHTHMTFAHTYHGEMVMSGSTLTVDSVLTLGHLDAATIDVTRSTINADTFYLGRYATADADLAGTEVNCQKLYVAYDHSPDDTTRLDLTSDDGVPSSINISGASPEVVLATNGRAIITQSSGSFDAADAPVTLASNADSYVFYVLGGGSFTTDNMTVGRRGDSMLTQNGGAVEVLGELTIAKYAESSATYNLNGGTATIHGFAAGAGNGTLNIDGGTLMLPHFHVEVQKINVGYAMYSDGDFFLGPRTLNVDQLIIGGVGHGRLDAQHSNISVAGDLHVGLTLNYVSSPTGPPIPMMVSSSLEQQGGEAHAMQVFLGTSSGGWGIYDQDGGSLEADYLYVGYGGWGEFNQQDDAVVNIAEELHVGSEASGHGTYRLTGSSLDATLDTHYTYVGVYGHGTFLHEEGRHDTSHLRIGYYEGSDGVYDFSGGELETSLTYVGYSGTGQFDHSGGLHTTGQLRIGREGTGEYNLSGLSQITAGNEYLGSGGAVGTLTQSSGTNTVTGSLYVASSPASTATYRQTGGKTEVGGSVYVGRHADASGTFKIGNSAPLALDHGSLDVVDTLFVGHEGAGRFTQIGHAAVSADYVVVGYTSDPATDNSYRLEGGTLTIAEDLEVGQQAGSRGTFYLQTKDPDTLLSTDDTDVGVYGTGLFSQTGGQHETDHLRVGQHADADGQYGFSGGELRAGDTTVGDSGTGAFNHTGGLQEISADLFLGRGASGYGTYTLSGESHAYGRLSVGDTLYIGYQGRGDFYLDRWEGLDVGNRIVVGAQGRLYAGPGDVEIAFPLVNNGEVHVEGGDTLTLRDEVSGSGRYRNTGSVVFTSMFSPGESTAVVPFEGEVTLASGFPARTMLEIELADVDARVPHDLLEVDGGVSLGGRLALEAISKLHGPVGKPPREWYGDQTRTIINGRISGTFGQVPPTVPDPSTWANHGQGHLGYGVFLTDHGAHGRGVTYLRDAVEVDVLQAADGDTNGDRHVNGVDIQAILASNLFGVDADADWPQGDFDGNRRVNGLDIQAILAANLFGTGQYAAMLPNASLEPRVDLLLTSDGLLIAPGQVAVNGYVITSDLGVFTGGPADNLGFFQEDTDEQISGNFAFALFENHLLGDVIGDEFAWANLVEDLTFTYTVEGAAGKFVGTIVVAEPATCLLLATALPIVLLLRKRRRRRRPM